MIVNLYVDHMMSSPPTSSEEVWSQTHEHSKLFSDAAQRIGLTPAEYREFQNDLLDGKAMYVRLPRRMDAMSGNRRGSVYVVKNAVMTTPGMGWSVALADGNVVYVPQVCGNLSLLRHAALAHRPAPHHTVVAATNGRKKHAPFTPALGHVANAPAPAAAAPAETPVSLAPPADVPAAAEAPATVAQAAPVAAVAAAHGPVGFLFAIPAAIGGIIAGVTNHGSTPAPPCSEGSNLQNACQSTTNTSKH